MALSFEYAATLLASGGFGAVVLELIRRVKSKEDKKVLEANAAKENATGDSLIIDSVAGAVAAVTGSLRGEIERLQHEAHDLRDRAMTMSVELTAALTKVDALERQLSDKSDQILRLTADLDRVRGERDARGDRILQLEGEVRQLQSVIGAQARLTE